MLTAFRHEHVYAGGLDVPNTIGTWHCRHGAGAEIDYVVSINLFLNLLK